MWVPQSREEIEQLVTGGTLVESETFDAKEQLTSNNIEIAKDIAAMSTDGGVLIYGIGEDANKRLTRLTPVSLVGTRDRIEAIARTNISEPPTVITSTFELADDATKGYVVVLVPPSPRAPHMVIGKDDNRFYARTNHGNTILKEAEVARLYARRQLWEINDKALLNAVIAESTLPPSSDLGYLHLFVYPHIAPDDLLERARGNDQVGNYFQLLIGAASQDTRPPQIEHYPRFDFARTTRRISDGFIVRLGVDPGAEIEQRRGVLDLRIAENGHIRLMCGRAAELSNGRPVIFENLIAVLTARLIILAGNFYIRAQYSGPVTIGIAVTGIKSGISSWMAADNFRFIFGSEPYNQAEYHRMIRQEASVLALDPISIARRLTMPLIRATTQDRYDPFEQS